MKRFVGIFLLAALPALAKAPACPQVVAWNFDWDDNIFYMPTQIMLWDKQAKTEKGVSTGEWAVIREQIGKPGPWQNFEFRDDLKTGSLRYFADEIGDGVNQFERGIEQALKDKSQKWKGPSWDAFVRAMSREHTMRWTTIITARLHSPRTIREGADDLKKKGYFSRVPLEENIFPVAYPHFRADMKGSAKNPSEAKAMVMAMTLDRIQDVPVSGRVAEVMDADGKKPRRMHLWGFSDDDFGNYSKALSALSEQMKTNPKRWENVKLTLFFTGKNHPTEKARTVILTSNGEPRAPLPAEIGESEKVLKSLDTNPACR